MESGAQEDEHAPKKERVVWGPTGGLPRRFTTAIILPLRVKPLHRDGLFLRRDVLQLPTAVRRSFVRAATMIPWGATRGGCPKTAASMIPWGATKDGSKNSANRAAGRLDARARHSTKDPQDDRW